jgi:molybdenum cofactor biosynthesis protein MoaC
MVNITHKADSLRQAVAQAIVKVSRPETIAAIKNKTVPKGDVFEMAKTAGLFAVKRTSDMIPDCHPLPVEYTAVSYAIHELEIHMEVHTIYKTGVEVEAMHGVSVVALTMYDMLKPIDKEIEISTIKLLQKKGGKSDFKDFLSRELKASVVVCSDSISSGKKEDKAGKAIISKLETCGVQIDGYVIIPDEQVQIEEQLMQAVNANIDIILFTGGTGLSPRDVTPEAIRPLLDREIPGIMEAARSYGQQRTPFSMLSRSLAGMKGNTLVLALPGSTKGARETMDALFPSVLHIFRVLEGAQHF